MGGIGDVKGGCVKPYALLNCWSRPGKRCSKGLKEGSMKGGMPTLQLTAMLQAHLSSTVSTNLYQFHLSEVTSRSLLRRASRTSAGGCQLRLLAVHCGRQASLSTALHIERLGFVYAFFLLPPLSRSLGSTRVLLVHKSGLPKQHMLHSPQTS